MASTLIHINAKWIKQTEKKKEFCGRISRDFVYDNAELMLDNH